MREGKAFNVAEEVDELHSPVSKLMQSNHKEQATKPIQEMIRPYPIRFTLFDHTNVLNIMRKKKSWLPQGPRARDKNCNYYMYLINKKLLKD